jgi:hypothetical protein
MIDVGKVVQRAWELFQKDALYLIVGGILVTLLSAVTLGILGGPLHAGFVLGVMRRQREGRAPELNDIFAELPRFGRWVWPFYGMAIAMCIATALLVVPGILLLAGWMYVIPVMLDRPEASFRDARHESWSRSSERGFLQHFAVAALLYGIGAVLGVGTGVFAFMFPILGGGVCVGAYAAIIIAAYGQEKPAEPPVPSPPAP